MSCVKDKPKVDTEVPSSQPTAHKVWVCNEGNYGAANASLSYFNSTDNTVIEDYYKLQNNATIGDVLQSMFFFNGKYYLVVNNSNKILVCDSNMKKLNQINGFTSPRYFIPVNNAKAYVSDLYANKIFVLNLNTNSIQASIPCVGWTEQMQFYNGNLFVTNIKSNYVYVINTSTDVKTDSIAVGPNAASLLLDKDNFLWVLSSGDKSSSKLPQLLKIQTQSNQLVMQLTFAANEEPSHLCINKTKDTLFYLNKGVYKMPIQNSTLPSSALIEQGQRNYYGLAVSPYDNTIYLSDGLDYIQKSNCYVYSFNGQPLNLFKAGINANGFYFE